MFPDKILSVWRLALTSLQRNIPALLLYVVESKGSSPGRQGFFMVVNAAGEMEGSIGGGIMEHKFGEMARERLRNNDPIPSIRRQVHDKEVAKDQSGMICSGEQTIGLYILHSKDVNTLEQLIASLVAYKNGCLRLSPRGLDFSPEPPEKDFFFHQSSNEEWLYEEKTGYKSQLFIIGGGHVALAFSRIMRTMDFYISLFDDREALKSLDRNEHVHTRTILNDYGELSGLISGGEQQYVTVMTQGYRTDDLAVRALLPKSFRYFGLLGSKAKIGKLFETYRLAGIPEEQLKQLKAPAGLAIHSQTPEEIAISIAAEIIQTKASPIGEAN
jgi:xanthine dehydrogenase accessory factor